MAYGKCGCGHSPGDSDRSFDGHRDRTAQRDHYCQVRSGTFDRDTCYYEYLEWDQLYHFKRNSDLWIPEEFFRIRTGEFLRDADLTDHNGARIYFRRCPVKEGLYREIFLCHREQ